MANVLFTNVRIIDGTGAQPYTGEVLVQGNRISRIGRGSAQPAGGGRDGDRRRRRDADARHVRGAHALRLDQLQDAGRDPEVAARGAHALGGAGRRSSTSTTAGLPASAPRTPKPRLDCVIRNAIESGQIPGPRYLAASQEITVTGSLGDDMLPHLPYPDMSFGCVVDGPEEHAQGGAHVPQVRRRLRSSSTCPATTWCRARTRRPTG